MCVSLLTCLFLFFLLLLFSLFSFIFSFIFSFSLFHCTHRDEMNQTSDSTNKERPCTTRSSESRESYQSVNPCCVTTWEVLAVLGQKKPQAPLLVVPIRPCLIFMFCAACLDPSFLKILCIEKLMTANCSAECPTQHMRRSCGAEDV